MEDVIRWLLEGDVSVQYLTQLYLVGSDVDALKKLQDRIGTEGFGARYLSCQNENGHWGIWFYQPKWTCTHYSLLDLKNLGITPACSPCRMMVTRALRECMQKNGGINFTKSKVIYDICIQGMFLDYASYFCPDDQRLPMLVDFLLNSQNSDGGYGWSTEEDKSDPNTTISVLEGFLSFQKAGFTYRLDHIAEAAGKAISYLYENDLFINENKAYLKLSYPYRYHYSLLRVLEYLAMAELPYDKHIEPALKWLQEKQQPDGLWYLENTYKGNVHFEMEKAHSPSRFITLKSLYILKHYETLSGKKGI